jgi:5'(3')-deoxyribonucleotidase
MKILYIDMDNVLVDFRSAFPKISKDILISYKGREDEVPEIFSKMDPNPGAIDAFKKLSEIFDTYILSTSPWENPSAWSDKLNWVKKHLGKHAYKRLILTHHKDLNRGDFLVDDRLKNGAEDFQGEHIHFNTEKFPNWNVVTDYLTAKAGA